KISPKVTSCFPESVHRTTDVLEIFGQNFAGATSVKIGSVSMPIASNDTLPNGTDKITGQVPATAVSGKITVTTPSGSGISTGTLLVIQPPKVTSFTPAS